MKKAVSALLILALLCAFCCTAMAAGEQRSGDYRYKVLSDGTVEITRYSSYDSAALTIPESIDGHTVSSIGKNAFSGASKLKSITFKGKTTSIGKNSFKNINKKAVIKIKTSKKTYKKITKALNKESGMPKTVTTKRVK